MIVSQSTNVGSPRAPRKEVRTQNSLQESEASTKDSLELSFSDKTKNFVRDIAGFATPILAATGIGVVMASSGTDLASLGTAAMAVGGIMGVAVSTVMGHLVGKATAQAGPDLASMAMGEAERPPHDPGMVKAGGIVGAAWGLAAGVGVATGMGPAAILGAAAIGAVLTATAHGIESTVTGNFGVPVRERAQE